MQNHARTACTLCRRNSPSSKWRSLVGGVKQAILPTKGPATARLLHIKAGRSVTEHGHGGMELTVVLQGAYHIGDNCYSRGDLEIATLETEHQPVAAEGNDCICLAATDAALKFNGIVPKLLQPLMRI